MHNNNLDSVLDLPLWREIPAIRQRLSAVLTDLERLQQMEADLKRLRGPERSVSAAMSEVQPQSLVVPIGDLDLDKPFSLEVGDRVFKTCARTFSGHLQSKLMAVVRRAAEADSSIFVDRDGEAFDYLMRFLRDESQAMPAIPDPLQDRVLLEFKHWGVPPMAQSLVADLDAVFRTDPGEHWPGIPEAAHRKWKELGPISVQDILSQSKYLQMRTSPVQTKKFKEGVNIGQLQADGNAYGICRWVSDDQIEEGFWEKDRENNFCRVIYNDGEVYCGYCVNNKMHGYGKYVQSDGSIKEGEWEAGDFLG